MAKINLGYQKPVKKVTTRAPLKPLPTGLAGWATNFTEPERRQKLQPLRGSAIKSKFDLHDDKIMKKKPKPTEEKKFAPIIPTMVSRKI